VCFYSSIGYILPGMLSFLSLWHNNFATLALANCNWHSLALKMHNKANKIKILDIVD
jgi:hypothetical protein